jgi:hypothetical protein
VSQDDERASSPVSPAIPVVNDKSCSVSESVAVVSHAAAVSQAAAVNHVAAVSHAAAVSAKGKYK